MNRLIHKTPLQDNVMKGERKEILISFPNQSNVTGRNRMHVAVDDNHYSYYAYAYGGGSCGSREQSQACLSYAEMEQRRRGQRRIKLTGDNSVLDVNADYMSTISTLEKVTLYPSAYMVLTDRGYTKHYYTGMERVAARIGDGGLDVGIYLSNTDSLHARANRLYGQSLAQVNRRVLEANDVDCIMDGGQYMGDNGIFVEEIPERMQAEVSTEYGKFIVAMHQVSSDGGSPEVYYYHGDHLGSASWITDASGAAVQHLQYLPFGERFVDQRTSGYSERFTFTGKERDEETGYGYFGARYMDYELMTMWLSVDPLADKYPSISPYNYCMWNPIKVIDPMGMDTINTTDPSKPESKQLSKACKSSYPGMLIVNGHGAVPEGYPSSQSTTVKFDNNRYTMYNGSIEMKNGNTPEGIADFLKQYNGVYEENSRQGGLTIVILVVCRAGTELQVPEYPQDNIAQTLSKEMPNAIIIAPSWDVTLNYNLEYNNMNVYKDPYRHMPGHWNVYREGKKLDELPNYARLNSLVRVVPKRAFGYRYLIH